MSDTPPITLDMVQSVIGVIRHCEILGLKASALDDTHITIELPYSDKLIGNPDSRVIHGGALTTLLDTTCAMAVPVALGEFQVSPTLDLRIDYMTSAKPDMAIYARAEAYRVTNNVVFSKGIAFQDDPDKPIAHCVATFMRLPKETTDASQESQ